MDANDLHTKTVDKPPKSLLDKIAADPEIINRSVTDAGEPPIVVAPVVHAAEPDAGQAAQEIGVVGDGDTAPDVNLLMPHDAVVAPPVPVPAPAHKGRKAAAILVALLLLAGAGAAVYYAFLRPTDDAPVAVHPTPSPTPTATPTPTPTPSPTPTPTPTATPIPAQNSVTAPAAAPTADHPQTVSVVNKSGLWLRSSPDSSNRKNIIGWIPYGGKVSVDSVGSFWWHGTYNGKPGYFAVNYTK